MSKSTLHKLRIVSVVLIIGSMFISGVSAKTPNDPTAPTKPQHIPRVESSSRPETKRSQELNQTTTVITPTQNALATSAQTSQTASLASSVGPNLIINPSVEIAGTSGRPANWSKGGYGTNNRALTYPVAGYTGAKGLNVSITSYTSGDAKWYFDDVPVTAGATYQFSNYYIANIPSILTARFQLNGGAFTYKDIATLSPASSFTQSQAQIIVPTNAISLTVFHLINQAGTLTTDEFSLNEITNQNPNNLIANPGFETAGTSGAPQAWSKGRWGTNTTIFSYPVTGVNASKGAKVAMTSYTSGDAKWYFNPVPVNRGVYTYSTDYQSTITTQLTARVEHQNGSFTYVDFGSLPPSAAFVHASADFWIPLSAKNVTVFHIIKGIGELTVDNTSLTFTASPEGIFTTGAVTLAFDDGWTSQWDNAVPAMNAVGLPATFYIVTEQMADDGFPAFMSETQVTTLMNQGHEVTAHTRTHPALSTLTPAEQTNEIDGSRQDLLAILNSPTSGPVLSFSYPFGNYNATTIGLVKQAGFTNARSTLNGTVNPASDAFELPRFSAEVNTTFAQVKQAIDSAIAAKEWLILTFHQINTGTDQYTTSPVVFNQIIDYLDQQNTPIITVSEGIDSLY